LAADDIEEILGGGEGELVAKLKINAIVPLLNEVSLPAFVPHRASWVINIFWRAATTSLWETVSAVEADSCEKQVQIFRRSD
jgi:hypothetical protein